MCPEIASARVHLVFNYICRRPLRPARLAAWAPRVLSAQFSSFAKCISMLRSIVPTPSLIARPLFIIDICLHIYLYLSMLVSTPPK